jgi:hypothetical protein
LPARTRLVGGSGQRCNGVGTLVGRGTGISRLRRTRTRCSHVRNGGKRRTRRDCHRLPRGQLDLHRPATAGISHTLPLPTLCALARRVQRSPAGRAPGRGDELVQSWQREPWTGLSPGIGPTQRQRRHPSSGHFVSGLDPSSQPCRSSSTSTGWWCTAEACSCHTSGTGDPSPLHLPFSRCAAPEPKERSTHPTQLMIAVKRAA